MNPFKQFDKIYCLNLAKRKDRCESAKKEFEEHGIDNVIFIDAIDGVENGYTSIYQSITAGAIGAYKSHLMLLKKAFENGGESILIFEDDIKFCAGFDEFINEQLASVPDNWDFIYLGWADFMGFANATGNSVNEWVCKPLQPYGLFAYALRGKEMMERMIQFFEARIDNMTKQYDEYLCFEFWPFTHYNMYALQPPLIWYHNLGTNIQTNTITP